MLGMLAGTIASCIVRLWRCSRPLLAVLEGRVLKGAVMKGALGKIIAIVYAAGVAAWYEPDHQLIRDDAWRCLKISLCFDFAEIAGRRSGPSDR